MKLSSSDTGSISEKSNEFVKEESTESICLDAPSSSDDLGYKTFLRLQFEGQFRFVVLTGVYLSVVCTVMDAALILGVESSMEIPTTYDATALSKYNSNCCICCWLYGR